MVLALISSEGEGPQKHSQTNSTRILGRDKCCKDNEQGCVKVQIGVGGAGKEHWMTRILNRVSGHVLLRKAHNQPQRMVRSRCAGSSQGTWTKRRDCLVYVSTSEGGLGTYCESRLEVY